MFAESSKIRRAIYLKHPTPASYIYLFGQTGNREIIIEKVTMHTYIRHILHCSDIQARIYLGFGHGGGGEVSRGPR